MSFTAGLRKIKGWAARLETEVRVLYLAGRDERTPLAAKLLVALVVGYAVSPVDLIPDFIPILGYLDDVILIPFGVALAIRMIPTEILRDCRRRSESSSSVGPRGGRVGVAVVICTWLLVASAAVLFILHLV